MNIVQHELSALFPSMSQEELDALGEDIGVNGQREPITLYEGKVLDGWNRYRVCTEMGLKPASVEFEGDERDAINFVRSKNYHRRHLTPSQRASIEVSLSEWGGNKNSELPQGVPNGIGTETGTVLKSKADMAAAAGVGERTIARAREVKLNGTPTLQKAVIDGKISVNKAASIAALPKEQQQAALDNPPPSTPAPTVPNGDDGEPNLALELEAADQTIRTQQAVIESLQTGDLSKEVTAWALKYDQLNGRLQQELTTCAEAKKQAKYYGELLAKIRKALKVTTNGEILGALRQ
jgi:hypothetical protein